MNKIITFFVLFSVTVSAQWIYQHPLPTASTINGIQALSKNTYIAYGVNSTLLKTTDGGSTWQNVRLPITGASIYSIQMKDSLNGWATGSTLSYAGYVYKTTDGGSTWDSINTKQTVVLGDIQFFDSMNGYTGGGYMSSIFLSTTDGGETWTKISTTISSQISRIFFLNPQYGWIGNFSGNIHKTTDGGKNWIPQTTGATTGIDQFYFTDTSRGYFLSGGKIYKTTNGGTTWLPLTVPNFASVSSFNFVDSVKGIVFGSGVYKTYNGGITWVTVNQSSSPAKTAMADTLNGLGAGGSFLFASTTNGGTTWTEKGTRITKSTGMDIQFYDKDTGWAAMPKEILKTTNGGKVWNKISTTSLSVNDLLFIDSKTGWVVGNPAGWQHGVEKTTDGGATWTKYPTGLVKTHYTVSFINENNGCVAVDSGYVLFTTDGGSVWTKTHLGTARAIRLVTMLNTTTAIAVDDKGGVYKTVDGGNIWTSKLTSGSSSVTSIFKLNTNAVWITYNKPIAIKSTDAGDTWTQVTIGYENLRTIFFADENYGYASNTNNKMYGTIDGGTTWTQLTSPGQVEALYFVNKNLGFVTGYNGFIATTTTGGGLTSVKRITEEHIPDIFSLSQNYPNPFNPSTTINYQIPISGFVSLKVFDIIGREIADLVHQQQAAGNYTVPFNAASLSSGIYFYRLQSGKSVETKKMMLIK